MSTCSKHLLAASHRRAWPFATLAKRLAQALAFGGLLALIAFALAWRLSPFPRDRLDHWAASPAVLDAEGRPMLCLVGSDDQWRLPVPLAAMSPWLARATVAVEDQRFYRHGGIDPLAMLRAGASDLGALRIVSGASTLDMQVCRMVDPQPRTLGTKLVESFRALQLDRLKSKDEVLELYLNVAPYGGNVRGAEAASLAYFGKHARDLSLAEAALVAGLPQSPSRLRPDRNLAAALARQRAVLARMADEGLITAAERAEAERDPTRIRDAPPAPRATQVAHLALSRRPQGGRTTINLDIQAEVERLVDGRARNLPPGSETAVVVIDIAASAVVAMVGSVDPSDPVEGQVNGATALRSPGSALKPFIYAAAFESGRLAPDSIVHDCPICRAGWSPENFDRTFAGDLPADEALRRSLNVPAILVAEGVGLARCCGTLEAAGLRLPADAPSRGGLALAVGGIEVTLLDLTAAYATLGRGGVARAARLFADEPAAPVPAIDSNVCAALGDILSSRRRRPAGMEDLQPADVPWFMWKTGTSAGRRDAWAVGHNTRYAVGVWAGRFRGTGRTDFVGAQAAEPLLASLFQLPRLLTDRDPPPPAPILVRRPLPVPAEVAADLRITVPSEGEAFVALGGQAVVRPQANRPSNLSWFLNGRLIDERAAARLTLAPGQYELRCTDASGRATSAVRFTVRPAEGA